MFNTPDVVDPHSSLKRGQPVLVHVDFTVHVGFSNRQLAIHQMMQFDRPGWVHLDCRGQRDITLHTTNGEVTEVEPSPEDPALGSCILVLVPSSLKIDLNYITDPDALGIQWLTPELAESDHPMLYTQFETINARSVFIVQDAPSIRFTYTMNLRVPPQVRGLPAANTFVQRTEGEHFAIESWEMTVPVPAYLIAINVGDFVQHTFDDRCSVWAERRLIERAAIVLRRTPDVIAALENLFGPYRWGTCSTIILPARGFPFAAMEHPCLTSMNAMLLENEYATLRVLIHELTHSWFGNLITNSHWGDFWLNEGVTTFGEWFGLRAMFGVESMQMQIIAAIAELRRIIDKSMQENQPERTCLHTDLRGQNPDDSFSRVPYYKGALFLWRIMEIVGEGKMIEFLRSYIEAYQYASIDSEEFLQFAAALLGEDVLGAADARTWVYQPGLPEQLPYIASEKAGHIAQMAEVGVLKPLEAMRWEYQEWDVYLSHLTRDKPAHFYVTLLDTFGDRFGNGMLMSPYLQACLEAPAFPIASILGLVEEYLCAYGRTIYICPLYRALCEHGLYDEARRILDEAKIGYHPISADQAEKVLAQYAPNE